MPNDTFSDIGGNQPAAQVAFSQVTPNLRTPFVAIEIDPTNANGGGLNQNLPALLIGSYDNTISAVVSNVPVQVFSASQVGADYGNGSLLHEMAIAWFANNPNTPVCVAPVPDAGGASVSRTAHLLCISTAFTMASASRQE